MRTDRHALRPCARGWRNSFNDDEIKAIWRAGNKLGGVEGRFLKALLLTGKRKGALSRMKWEHINTDWFWLPPASESNKNKRLLPVPLSKLRVSWACRTHTLWG